MKLILLDRPIWKVLESHVQPSPLAIRRTSRRIFNKLQPPSLRAIDPAATMSGTDASQQDPLLSLRRAIASGTLPTPTTSSELSDQHATEDLAQATHLYFTQPIAQAIPLSTPTRFISAATQSGVDLRSIFFAWQKKDVAIQEYITSAEELNEALKGKGKEEKVQNLVFVERLDLLTWLEGASDESEYIKPLEGAAAAAEAAAAAAGVAQAEASAGIASGAAGGISSVPSGVTGAAPAGAQGARAQKPIDPRLQEIYNGERKTGDRNTVLRGIKPTVSPSSESKPPRRQSTNVMNTGLLPRSQKRRTLPRPQPFPPRSTRHQTQQQEHNNSPSSVSRTSSAIVTKTQLPSRPNHPPFPISLLPHPYVQHQILPARRHFRSTGPSNTEHVHRSQFHGTQTTTPPQIRPIQSQRRGNWICNRRPRAQADQIHSGGWYHQFQTGVLVPPRRGVHDWSDLAIQIIQVVVTAGTLQACNGYLCWLARRRCSPAGQRLGSWCRELCCRTVG